MVPSAIDPDSRENGIQRYILEPDTDMFTLEVNTKMDGSTDVKVVLQKQLDRERQQAYQVHSAHKEMSSDFLPGLCCV